MSESENILRRLKEQTPYTNVLDGELMKDAAAAMEALRAENAKLRAALKPLVAALEYVHRGYSDDLSTSVRIGDLRAAAAVALKETGDE